MVKEFKVSKETAVLIEKNDTKLGKPFIVKFYKDWVLVESIPYDSVEEIDFNYIRQRQWKSST